MKTSRWLPYLLFLLSIRLAEAQEVLTPLKQKLTFTVSELGDARIEASMTLTAGQWDNYKRMLGNNPDILKRQMERALPAYYLQNFKYQEDAMARTYTLSFDALGLSRINEKGLWQIDMDLKNPDITQLSESTYSMTSSINEQGTLIQQVATIHFPDGASRVKQDKNAFGKAVFTYSLTPGNAWMQWLLPVAGLLLLAAGIFLYFRTPKSFTNKLTSS